MGGGEARASRVVLLSRGLGGRRRHGTRGVALLPLEAVDRKVMMMAPSPKGVYSVRGGGHTRGVVLGEGGGHTRGGVLGGGELRLEKLRLACNVSGHSQLRLGPTSLVTRSFTGWPFTAEARSNVSGDTVVHRLAIHS